MKIRLLISALILITISCNQRNVAKETETSNLIIDNKYSVPQLIDLSNDNNSAVDIINSRILDWFMIDSIEQSEADEFRWSDISFSTEIKENIFHVFISGEFYGAYPNYVSDALFFDLETGEVLDQTIIPFQALFTLPGYLAFLNKFWLDGVQKEFIAAVECANYEPHCSYYDINDYRVKDKMLSVYLTSDCYPHVLKACSPEFYISVEIDSVNEYLNSLGKYILLERNYKNLTAIEEFIDNEKIKEMVPNNVFLFGNIDDNHPVSMAINIENPDSIFGLFYNHNNAQEIALRGYSKDYKMFLTGTESNKPTGFFEFNIDSGNYPIDGQWVDSIKTKSYKVKFETLKTCFDN